MTRSPESAERIESSRRRLLVPLVVLAIVAVPMTVPGALSARNGHRVHAVTVVDGVERPVQVGDTLAQGRLVGDGSAQFCEMPPTSFGIIGTGDGQGESTLRITSDCSVVVETIDAPIPFAAGNDSGSMRSVGRPSGPAYETFGETHGANRDQ